MHTTTLCGRILLSIRLYINEHCVTVHSFWFGLASSSFHVYSIGVQAVPAEIDWNLWHAQIGQIESSDVHEFT